MHVPNWEPGTQYQLEDVVQYNDHHYKIIQPHRSQSDWPPSDTPALWGRLRDDDGDSYQHQHQHQQPQHPQQAPQYSDDKNPEPTPEPHKHWYEDDSTKKKLEVGAGLAGGAALLAGGIFAYKKHEQHKEEGKAKVWARNNWIEEARSRTDVLRTQGPSGPAVWVLTRGKSIPDRAIATGQEHGRKLYSSRAFHEGALVIGKASEEFNKGCVIGYADDEIEVEEFEVLVGDINGLHWANASGKLNVASLGRRPVEGGNEKDGTSVYIARAPYKGAEHPGKASEKLDGAYITYGGEEKVVKEYQVLCYK